MPIWGKPHISKIYEAITAIADSRIEFLTENKARCSSSSRGKYYDVEFDWNTNSMMSNDNSAYYTHILSYPMIAVLMLKGKIEYDKTLLEDLKGIFWKQINQKYKNDYDKAIAHVLDELKVKGKNVTQIKNNIEKIYKSVCKLEINQLGKLRFPPKAF